MLRERITHRQKGASEVPRLQNAGWQPVLAPAPIRGVPPPAFIQQPPPKTRRVTTPDILQLVTNKLQTLSAESSSPSLDVPKGLKNVDLERQREENRPKGLLQRLQGMLG